jgi:formylglycine-generating enzyme required for sulfatase activity
MQTNAEGRTIRVFCFDHKLGFTVFAGPRIMCASQQHSLDNDFPYHSFWTYCCICDTFWPSNDTGKQDATNERCPNCDEIIARRYLCASCCVAVIDSDVEKNRRKFAIPRASDGPLVCPGCLDFPTSPSFEHYCHDLSFSFRTNRTVCPFCEDIIVQLPSFPTLAGEFLTSLGSGDKLTVGFDILEIDNNLLVPSPEGEFFLIGSGSGHSSPIVLPKRTEFTAKSDHQRYSELYDCQQPGVGNIRILSPAVVEKMGGGWLLKERGRLEIVTLGTATKDTVRDQRFPRSVADFLKSRKRTSIVRPDFQNGILIADPDDRGELLLIRDSATLSRPQTLFLIPRLTQLQTKQEFRAYFEEYYECARPSTGEVWIIDPAIVSPVKGGWQLTKKGVLEVRGKEIKEEQTLTLPSVTRKSPIEQQASPVKEVTTSPSVLFRLTIILAVMSGLIVVVWRLTSSTVKPSSNATKSTLNAPSTTSTMVTVPGGEFTMGSDSGDAYERPAHKVIVKPFLIDINEVTCQEYEAFIKATGHKAPQGWVNGTYPHGGAHWPVTGVDWYDATAYAQWVRKRLPTEEEWEFAARGTTGWRYPWGNEWMSEAANTGSTSNHQLADVGEYSKGASPFGAFDMVGNAWEWTASKLIAYPGGQIPKQPNGLMVIRGGSWQERQGQATATYRGYLPASGGKDYSATSFRCAKDESAAN